jgi:hypothetical protein
MRISNTWRPWRRRSSRNAWQQLGELERLEQLRREIWARSAQR